jgi:imidazolonepropionase-like amidohydrolase
MGRSDLGAIAPGKLADVVLLDADPLADVANLSRAGRVIKGGVVYDPKALIDSIR